jgi:hypothetical protein
MEEFKLVGLHAASGSGKTTLSYSLEQDGYKCVAFAEPIKQIIRLLFDVSFDTLEHRKHEESPLGLTWTQLLQKIGDLGRGEDPNFWVNIAMRKVRKLKEAGESAILITDVRYPNEAVEILKEGGIIVEIVRPNPTERKGFPGHSSTKRLPDHLIHATVENNSSLWDFYKKFNSVVNSELLRRN